MILNDKDTIKETATENKEYQLLKKIEIPFSEYVQISKKRRPVYFKNDLKGGESRLPKGILKKLKAGLYDWDIKGYLYNKLTGEVLVRNNKSVGTPREQKVNGQNIYNGNVSRQARATLVKALHEKFARYLKDIDPIVDIKHFPLGIHLIFKVHDRFKFNLDNDNRWIWEKTIQDTLVQEKIIPEDNPYVVWENLKRTILIPNEVEETLIVEIYGYA